MTLPRRSPVIASAILAGVLGHARTYVPRLEILHHALNRNLVQQHEIADADVVGVRHLALFYTRTRDAHTQIHQVNSRDQPPRATDPRALTPTVGWLACSLHRRPTSLSRVAILHGECGHLQASRSFVSIGRWWRVANRATPYALTGWFLFSTSSKLGKSGKQGT